jgi:predicted Rossmann-fold nucleotide-binding protein/phosphoglycolate phosphatase-like HAD superfamily hydrolase
MHSQKQIAVFGSFLANSLSDEYQMAEDLGCQLAKSGFKLICGGHGGIVTPLVSGAIRGGGKVRGISLAESRFPKRDGKMNPLLTEMVIAGTISERLDLFLHADGYIFFTGGIGSLAEFAFIWHSLQVAGDFGRPIIFVSGAWKHVLAAIKQQQMIKFKYYRHLYVCERVADAVAIVTNDYSAKYDAPERIVYGESVVFDMDGTLVESPEEAFARSCENIGCFFPLPAVAEAFGKARLLLRTDEGKEAADDDFQFLMNVLENLGMNGEAASGIAEHLHGEPKRTPDLYDDVADTLSHLKANGFSTGIVSSRHPSQLEEIVSTHNLSGLLDFVATRGRGAEESAGRRFGEEVQASGFRKDGMIHVGVDPREDYLAPRAARVDSILLDRHLTHLLNDTAFKIRSLQELKCLVRHR